MAADEPLIRSPHRRTVMAGGLAPLLAGCAGGASTTADGSSSTGSTGGEASSGGVLDGVSFQVRRDPGCGCCLAWVDHLDEHGAVTEVTEDAERSSFRTDAGIPDSAASCHTAVTGDLVIEGHVPAAAIRRFLDDAPDAVGLALPGMPADSPGMGGDEVAWAAQAVMLVDRGGALSPFDY